MVIERRKVEEALKHLNIAKEKDNVVKSLLMKNWLN